MKAIITKDGISNARQPENKELIDTFNVVGKNDGQLHNFVTARFYMGRSSSASVVYCCLWVHGKDCYPSGKGSAGGWGYHKQSSALADAISSAGIELYGSPYAGESYTHEQVSNPEFSEEAIDAAYAESTEAGNIYRNTHPRTIYRERTKAEINSIVRKVNKQRAHIGGCGHQSMIAAVEAIARAAGARGKLLTIHN